MSDEASVPDGAVVEGGGPGTTGSDDPVATGQQARTGRRRLPRASVLDTIRVSIRVLLPLLGRGVIVRRPPVVDIAERLDLDRRAVREMQRLNDRYGEGPLLLRLPGRRLALVLDGEHVQRILRASPDPFSAANLEKVHALGAFQPQGVLISEGEEREDRRRFNEAVLETPRPIHSHAETFLVAVREQADEFLRGAEATGRLTWEDFVPAWYRLVRTVTLGEAARDDHELTDLLGKLRAKANWSYLRPTDQRLRARFLGQLQSHVDRAEPGSLAAMMAATPTTEHTVPHQQVPQWLFAFEPAGMAAYRTLALLDAHPDTAAAVREELASSSDPAELPLLRASVLESLRLWPTTPGILRDGKENTAWERGVLPAGTGLVIFAPYFHRDDRHLPEADRFAPELWTRERSAADWPLVPFSDGPVVCPGRNLVLLLTTSMLAALLEEHEHHAVEGGLDRSRPLPSLLSPFNLTFRVERR
jgi:cytochrome P450